jgi:hypothetical protein
LNKLVENYSEAIAGIQLTISKHSNNSAVGSNQPTTNALRLENKYNIVYNSIQPEESFLTFFISETKFLSSGLYDSLAAHLNNEYINLDQLKQRLNSDAEARKSLNSLAARNHILDAFYLNSVDRRFSVANQRSVSNSLDFREFGNANHNCIQMLFANSNLIQQGYTRVSAVQYHEHILVVAIYSDICPRDQQIKRKAVAATSQEIGHANKVSKPATRAAANQRQFQTLFTPTGLNEAGEFERADEKIAAPLSLSDEVPRGSIAEKNASESQPQLLHDVDISSASLLHNEGEEVSQFVAPQTPELGDLELVVGIADKAQQEAKAEQPIRTKAKRKDKEKEKETEETRGVCAFPKKKAKKNQSQTPKTNSVVPADTSSSDTKPQEAKTVSTFRRLRKFDQDAADGAVTKPLEDVIITKHDKAAPEIEEDLRAASYSARGRPMRPAAQLARMNLRGAKETVKSHPNTDNARKKVSRAAAAVRSSKNSRRIVVEKSEVEEQSKLANPEDVEELLHQCDNCSELCNSDYMRCVDQSCEDYDLCLSCYPKRKDIVATNHREEHKMKLITMKASDEQLSKEAPPVQTLADLARKIRLEGAPASCMQQAISTVTEDKETQEINEQCCVDLAESKYDSDKEAPGAQRSAEPIAVPLAFSAAEKETLTIEELLAEKDTEAEQNEKSSGRREKAKEREEKALPAAAVQAPPAAKTCTIIQEKLVKKKKSIVLSDSEDEISSNPKVIEAAASSSSVLSFVQVRNALFEYLYSVFPANQAIHTPYDQLFSSYTVSRINVGDLFSTNTPKQLNQFLFQLHSEGLIKVQLNARSSIEQIWFSKKGWDRADNMIRGGKKRALQAKLPQTLKVVFCSQENLSATRINESHLSLPALEMGTEIEQQINPQQQKHQDSTIMNVSEEKEVENVNAQHNSAPCGWKRKKARNGILSIAVQEKNHVIDIGKTAAICSQRSRFSFASNHEISSRPQQKDPNNQTNNLPQPVQRSNNDNSLANHNDNCIKENSNLNDEDASKNSNPIERAAGFDSLYPINTLNPELDSTLRSMFDEQFHELQQNQLVPSQSKPSRDNSLSHNARGIDTNTINTFDAGSLVIENNTIADPSEAAESEQIDDFE